MAQPLLFRRLQPDELDAAYTIVRQAAAWLQHRDLPHWLISRRVYQHRHMLGQNYGLLVADELAVVLSLAEYYPADWREYLIIPAFIWLATLASAEKFKGQGLGRIALLKAEEQAIHDGKEVVFLDCYYGDGALPNYYASVGYEWVARKQLCFEDGSLHDSVLMRKEAVERDP